MARRKTTKPIDSYSHDEAERVNNPPVGLVDAANDPDGDSKTYRHVNRAVFAGPPPQTTRLTARRPLVRQSPAHFITRPAG